MSTRALSFGRAADAYERFRLGYPDELVDRIVAYASAPVRRALEVGAGTGKATRMVAGRGVAVTACEPDPQMAALLRRSTERLPVEVVVARFEELTGGPYDLLYAASSWHWTEPETRWTRTAALLHPGGTVAVFGSSGAGSRLADRELREAVAAVRRTVIPDETRVTQQRSPSGRWWPGNELDAEPSFSDVVEHDVARVVERSREDYLGALSTVSAYLVLPGAVRARLLRTIADVLPETVRVEAAVRLHLARRR